MSKQLGVKHINDYSIILPAVHDMPSVNLMMPVPVMPSLVAKDHLALHSGLGAGVADIRIQTEVFADLIL